MDGQKKKTYFGSNGKRKCPTTKKLENLQVQRKQTPYLTKDPKNIHLQMRDDLLNHS